MNKIINRKFLNKYFTSENIERAHVTLKSMKTLWFNTGTLCNLKCKGCYIESSPINDSLEYLTETDVSKYLNELDQFYDVRQIGFTGGEPFMNPYFIEILEDTLSRGYEVLVLTNGMKPMQKLEKKLLNIKNNFDKKLMLRVSLDHYSKSMHELERGNNTWEVTIRGLKWLSDNNFNFFIASRKISNESEHELRNSFKELINNRQLDIDPYDPKKLIFFSEMDKNKDTIEISENCWSVLNVDKNSLMCSSSRIIVKHRNDDSTSVQPCTLLSHIKDFKLGKSLKESSDHVYLNHKFCSQFCVLGGSKCNID